MNNELLAESLKELDAGVTGDSDIRTELLGSQDSRSLANETYDLTSTAANKVRQILPESKSGGPRTLEGKQKSKLNALKYGIFASSVLIKGESSAAYKSLLDGLADTLAPVGKLEEILVEKLATTLWRHRRLIQAEGAEIQKRVDLVEWEQEIRKCQSVNIHLSITRPGLISDTNNLYVINRCLDLLSELRRNIFQNGFTKSDLGPLREIYGNDGHSSINLGDNFYEEYLRWSETAKVSEAQRLKNDCASPERCKDVVLDAIDSQIRLLKERLAVESMRRAVPESPALDRLLRYESNLERIFDRTMNQLERLQRMRLGHPVSPSINLNVSSS